MRLINGTCFVHEEKVHEGHHVKGIRKQIIWLTASLKNFSPDLEIKLDSSAIEWDVLPDALRTWRERQILSTKS